MKVAGEIFETSMCMEQVSSERLQTLLAKEKELQWRKTLMHSLPIGIVLIDANGFVKDCNQEAIALLDEPLTGEAWVNIITRCFAPQADDLQEISLKDGRKISIHISATPDARGQTIVLSDLTATRETQARFSQQQRLIEMGNMVASLAHQLRTPIAAAMLYASHLSDSELDISQQKKFSKKIVSRLKSIENQVSDMLLFAKSDKLITERTTLKEFTHELTQALEFELIEHEAIFTIQNKASTDVLDCNCSALIGAIQNLVNNAIQATGVGAVLTLHITEAQNELHFMLEDNGPGIDADKLEKVSEPFYTTKTHGTGLGLAVVKAVARSHHGMLSINSNTNKGSQIGFSIALDLANRLTTNTQGVNNATA